MHALLAHAYHLALNPLWRAPAAALLAGLCARLALRGQPGLGAILAILIGWLVLLYPSLTVLPAKPLDRLPGLALLLGLLVWWRMRGAGRGVRALFILPAGSALLAWWMAGAPLRGPGIAACVPVFLGTWAALALTIRLSRGDATGWATLAAASALGAGIDLAGGAAHWARAALIPACASLSLLGLPAATEALALAVTLTACLTILASDRGRFIPVDLAILAPLLVWTLAPRILPRLNRAGPALAAAFAAACGLAIMLAAGDFLARH